MIARVVVTKSAACGVRSLSTAAAAASTSDVPYSFVHARTAYRAEIAVMRKQFIADEKRRKEKLARDAEAQRLKIMKAKAARLEIKRQQQAIRAEEVAREKALHEEKVRQYFEEKVLVREERAVEVELRRQAVVDTLRQQSDSWVTETNYTEKLKEDVFTYSPQQLSARSAFDPSNTTGSAVSWLEKLQRMRPAGVQVSDDEVAASAVAAAADKPEEPAAATDATQKKED